MILYPHFFPENYQSFHFRMVRNYIKKTKRAETPRHLIETGVNEIIFWGRSIRSLAIEIGIDNSTLGRYVKQAQVITDGLTRIKY